MDQKPLQALEKAIEVAGSQAELARRIHTPLRPIRQQHVWNWLNRDKKVPPEVVIDIERETAVSRHELRPDIYPIEAEPKVATA